MVFHNELYSLIFQFTGLYLDFYTIYSRDVKFSSVGIGFALNLLIYTIVVIVSLKDKNIENSLLTKIIIISLLTIPLSLINPLITRSIITCYP